MKAAHKHMPATNTSDILIAPFRGITVKAYRNALSRHFGYFNEAYAPFVSGIGEHKISPGKLADILPYESMLSPTVPQIIGNNAKEIILYAKAIEDAGFDHLNWNLGCPFARIANKKRGCGMLPYPAEIDQILHEVYPNISINLSIKMRLGYKDASEIGQVLSVLNAYPLKHIILHPRTGLQAYGGQASTDAFLEATTRTQHKLIYNGDVFNLSRYNQLRELLPDVSSWMLGRGVLINPFLPSEIRGVIYSDQQKRNILGDFHHELWSYYMSSGQEKRSLGMLKAIWYYMAGVFSNGSDVFKRIKRAKTRHTYTESIAFALEQAFASDQELESYFKKLSTKF